MGRRKIEIQPITHERNRAVTFLKRKNGLFKKAYELGVLCSVDVAVIIFEERQGQLKLYQYCSSDVGDIVQRQLSFDGDRDTKTPADFSNSKGDDGGDEEDEIDEEEAAGSSKQTSKKEKSKETTSSKHKDSTHGGSSGSSNAIPIRPAQTPTSESPMEVDSRPGSSRVHSRPASTTSNIPILPVSNDRLTSTQSTPRGSTLPTLGSGISMPLPIPINIPPLKRPRLDDPVVPPPGLSFPYRLDVDLNTYPPTAHATSLPPQSHSHSHPPPPHIPANISYPHNAIGLMGMHNPNVFPPSSFDLPGRPSMSYPMSQQSQRSSYAPSLEGLFGQRPGPGAQSQTTNMLLDLLNSTSMPINHNNQSTPYPSFDWPVTNSSSSQSEVHHHQRNSSQGSNNDAASWLEFLTTSSPPGGQGTMTLGGLPTPTNRTPASSVSSVHPASPMPSKKRHRQEGSGDNPGNERASSRDEEREGRKATMKP